VIKNQKNVAGNLRKPIFLIARFSSELQLLGTFFSVAVLMAFYETLKEIYFKGGLTLVESHAITVVVSATLATILRPLSYAARRLNCMQRLRMRPIWRKVS